MEQRVLIEKHVGQTPLEAVEAWRKSTDLSTSIPLAYAGRLDPMASGKLLVLIGDECKRQKEYHGLDKEYRFEVLLGFRSDTGDILGMAEKIGNVPSPDENMIEKSLRSLRGGHKFPYPRFSAKTVRGIPLHEWTLRGGLADDEIPTYEARVHRINFESIRSLDALALLSSIREKIATIPTVTDPRKALGADFRRGEILPRWQELLGANDAVYTLVEASAVVSSGTYIRTLAGELGKRLGTYGLAYSIHRTEIGQYRSIVGPFGYWRHRLT